mmetsp:Transcript_151196/g.261983  ORF Transcript_151196/g.261983 Transcript_151196/m.261983 type:complete len:151 (-) Transcript_151196:38-490(-)
MRACILMLVCLSCRSYSHKIQPMPESLNHDHSRGIVTPLQAITGILLAFNSAGMGGKGRHVIVNTPAGVHLGLANKLKEINMMVADSGQGPKDLVAAEWPKIVDEFDECFIEADDGDDVEDCVHTVDEKVEHLQEDMSNQTSSEEFSPGS